MIETKILFSQKINSLEIGFSFKDYINQIGVSSTFNLLANKDYLTVIKINYHNNSIFNLKHNHKLIIKYINLIDKKHLMC